MTTFRCPKHDVTFEAVNPPSVRGHLRCPLCAKERGVEVAAAPAAAKPAAPDPSTVAAEKAAAEKLNTQPAE
jgi:hypothetical protein